MVGMFPAKVRRYVAGKYVQEPGVPGGMTALCTLSQAAIAFGAELKDLVTVKSATISGRPALQLADKRHSTNAYVLRASSTHPRNRGSHFAYCRR
jgi:hypothetical protein